MSCHTGLLPHVKGLFVLKTSSKKNGQVLNKPIMRLLLKNPGGTLSQI